MNRRERSEARVLGLFLAGAAWISGAAAGFYCLMIYEMTPGPAGAAPVSWPTTSSLARISGVPNIVMAVHPKCPCTRSSLDVLEEIAVRSRGPMSARLLVYQSMKVCDGWDEPTLRALSERKGLEIAFDPGGCEAERFGLSTSGATAVFDGRGQRQFIGGLNLARGRAEISRGGLAVLAVLAQQEPKDRSASAFGCPLSNPDIPLTSTRR
jgi:hypothetical protein